MAEVIKKFMREFTGDRKGSGYKFYDRLEDAINDLDARVKPFVYESNFILLGEVKLTLVRINPDGSKDAVRAVVKVGEPTDPPTRKARK